MKISAVIFDFDGVIFNSEPIHAKAWQIVFKEYGIPFDKHALIQGRGLERLEVLRLLLESANVDLDLDTRKEIANKKNSIYLECIKLLSLKDMDTTIIDTLRYLRNKGYKIALGSSSKNAKIFLSNLGIAHLFDEVLDGNDVLFAKPNPEIFLKAASSLNEKPENCLIVEDGTAGIEAAYKGGFYSAGISEASKHLHVSFKLDKVSDLADLL